MPPKELNQNYFSLLGNDHRTELPNCVFEWHPMKPQQVPPEPLTTLELSLLGQRHGSTKVNTDRAQAVKTYRANGCTLTEIAAYLRGKPGCGKRMIATDLAALSEAERKTGFANAMQQKIL